MTRIEDLTLTFRVGTLKVTIDQKVIDIDEVRLRELIESLPALYPAILNLVNPVSWSDSHAG